MEFKFSNYMNGERLCIKPLMPGAGGRNYGLGYFAHCTSPSTMSNVKLKKRYYGHHDMQFHFYDIKLCHTMTYGHYEEFLDNFIKRGKNHNCVVHISNSMIPAMGGVNDLVSLHEIDYFHVVLNKVMSMENDLIVEVSNKITTESNDIEKEKILGLSKKLYKNNKVKHYIILEEIYKRKINSMNHAPNEPWDIEFLDDYVVHHQELRRYDGKPKMYFINGVIQEDFNGIDMINMKQQREN
jgi:hypothetical protein